MGTVIEFNVSNANKTLLELKKYNRRVEKALDDGFKEFIQKLEEKLVDNMSNYGVASVANVTSITTDRLSDGVIIYLNNDILMYLEYGTGIVGEENPHPKASKDGWIYDVNDHNEEGWWYPTTYDDPNPYKWTDPNGVLRAWTKGQISKPFVYETWLWGRRSINNIVGKHLRRALK